MNVILKKEVPNLGKYGDRVKVAEGYARNYLIPKDLAAEATAGNLKQFEAEKEAFLSKEKERMEKAEKLRSGIEALSLTFRRKAGEDKKLFGSVTAHDIESELKGKGFNVEKKDVLLEEAIKTLGNFTVSVKLHPEVTAVIKIGVVKEE